MDPTEPREDGDEAPRWNPAQKLSPLANAEAKLADAYRRGDENGVYYWKERVSCYQRAACRNLSR